MQSRLVFFLACAMVLVLTCLSAGCSSYQSPAAPTATTPVTPVPTAAANSITIKNFAFSPAMLTVKAGSVVTWTNQDSVTHTIASDSGYPVLFTSDPVASGASYTFTFIQPGTYNYHCSIHPSMKGTIIVQS